VLNGKVTTFVEEVGTGGILKGWIVFEDEMTLESVGEDNGNVRFVWTNRHEVLDVRGKEVVRRLERTHGFCLCELIRGLDNGIRHLCF
jgi:hypothetical protein